jgi:hypothetical protein
VFIKNVHTANFFLSCIMGYFDKSNDTLCFFYFIFFYWCRNTIFNTI